VNLSTRSTAPEELDLADPATYRLCLTELDFINRVTFTHRPTLRWLARATNDLPVEAAVCVMDVAYGHGDLLRAIARWADRRGRRVQLSGVDLNPRCAEIARETTPPSMDIDYMTGDVFNYDGEVLGRPDFIVSSQFTHHLTDAQVVRFLDWIDGTARLGWHIADLNRNVVAYSGFQVLARLMGVDHMVKPIVMV
jgi:2-polyprenyl-3-methyl-5-hydroxy-6-metoxy-1,4-benzoquinol methylase